MSDNADDDTPAYTEIYVDPYPAIKDANAQRLCVQLAKQHYYRFDNIRFTHDGLIVTSGDQGGHPFPAITISIAADPEAITAACMGLLLALSTKD